MTTMEIFNIILMGAASALCIALIFYFGKITKTVTSLDKEIKDIVGQLRPVTVSVTNLTEKLNGIADEIKTPLNASINVFLQLKDRIDGLLEIEETVRETIITQVNAIANGIKSFTDVYKGNGHIPHRREVFRS